MDGFMLEIVAIAPAISFYKICLPHQNVRMEKTS